MTIVWHVQHNGTATEIAMLLNEAQNMICDFFMKIDCAGECTNAPEVTYIIKHKVDSNAQEIIQVYFEALKKSTYE